MAQRHAIPHIGIMHEVTQAKANLADQRLFDFHIGPDPTLLLSNPIVFKTGRLVPQHDKPQPVPEIPTIGSFGFGTAGKGFERLITKVQEEFDRAVIRLNIPFASFGDAGGEKARAIGEKCRALITKPGITLDLKHDFMGVDQLLDFLAQNSLNAFLYEYQNGRGISSVVDHALAVKRPLALTRSSMFRHVNGTRPPITVEDARLSDILARGFAPLARYAEEWTPENLRWDYERIVDAVLRQARTTVAAAAPAADLGPARQIINEVGRKVVETAAPLLRQAQQQLAGSPYGERIAARSGSFPCWPPALRALQDQIGGAAPTGGASASADWIPRVAEGSGDGRARSEIAPYVPVSLPPPGRTSTVSTGSSTGRRSPPTSRPSRICSATCRRSWPARSRPRTSSRRSCWTRSCGWCRSATAGPSLLCVGSYEDTAAGAIALGGLPVDEVDPVINYDLTTFLTKPSARPGQLRRGVLHLGHRTHRGRRGVPEAVRAVAGPWRGSAC